MSTGMVNGHGKGYPRQVKITRITVFHCDTPFKNGFQSPHLLRLSAESIIIHIQFSSGISGYGESAPRLYVTGETTASVAGLMRDHFSRLLLGQEIVSVNDIERTLSSLEDACRTQGIASYLSALGAVDIALLNALSKSLNISVSALLGPLVRDTITYTLPIPLLPHNVIRELPRYLAGVKFSAIKVLMEESVPGNRERIELVRSLFGTDAQISIEANSKWTRAQAMENLHRLQEFNIVAVEQPVSSGDVDGLKMIRERTGIPVIVDESMCTLSDAQLLIDSGACDMLNIKVSKCGGLLTSKRIADFALSKGVDFQLGAHVGETNILNRAGQALALVSPNIAHFEGFSSFLFEDTRGEDSPMRNMNGYDFAEAGIGNHCLRMIQSFDL